MAMSSNFLISYADPEYNRDGRQPHFCHGCFESICSDDSFHEDEPTSDNYGMANSNLNAEVQNHEIMKTKLKHKN